MIRALSQVLSMTAVTFVAAHATPAHAEGAGGEGLQRGTAAPQFMLPVVNDFTGGKRWGPAKWTGGGAPAPDEQKKLVIMSFFATYCEPCKKEMPELARIYEAYKEQGLGVMLVSIDKGDEQKQQIIELAKQNNVTFPVMHDRFQVVARRYAAERLPYMLMLDGKGNVTNVHIGYTDEMKANLENEVRSGLGLPPLAPPAEEKAEPKKKPPAKKPTTAVKGGS
jgi:cytochrome c biogenesis protein CcmG, thiol:disulfide interchange protein DsbE